jgi:hypothetical protein
MSNRLELIGVDVAAARGSTKHYIARNRIGNRLICKAGIPKQCTHNGKRPAS